jgi:uncharacterized membrane protein YqjE
MESTAQEVQMQMFQGVQATPPSLSPTTRILGALSLMAVGVVHFQQYLTLYSSILTIGVLFVLNFAGAMGSGWSLRSSVFSAAGVE